MYQLNDDEISFILDDVRRNGVEMEDLQLNLLDHICCIIETELEENGDFRQFYHIAVKRFYKERLSEIEEETKSLLNNKYYYSMRKTMLVSGTLAAILMTVGIFFKFMHWPGAGISIVLGTIIFSLLFLPLVFTIKVKEKQQLKDKVLIGAGTLIAVMLSLGILFKIMHWPGANMLGTVSLFTMVLIYIPLFFFSGIKNKESKVNTIITSILMVSGCGLFLALARTPHSSRLQSIKDTAGFIRSEQILNAEKQLTNTGMNNSSDNSLKELSNSILMDCDQLKTGILVWETGYKMPGSDFEIKNALIGDGWVRIYFEENPAAVKLLDNLQLKLKKYNSALKNEQAVIHYIPEESIDFDQSEEKIGWALSDIVQVQMMVLQNLKGMNIKQHAI